jgi:hypothetical protein
MARWGLPVAVLGIWGAVALVSIFAPSIVTGSDGTIVPVVGLFAPSRRRRRDGVRVPGGRLVGRAVRLPDGRVHVHVTRLWPASSPVMTGPGERPRWCSPPTQRTSISAAFLKSDTGLLDLLVALRTV